MIDNKAVCKIYQSLTFLLQQFIEVELVTIIISSHLVTKVPAIRFKN